MSANNTELSEREREILRLVATGASNKEIGQELGISLNTVKVHVRNIFAKVGAASRTEATLYAIRTGLASVHPPGIVAPAEQDDEADTPLESTLLSPLGSGLPETRPTPTRRFKPHSTGWILLGLLLVLGISLVVARSLGWMPTRGTDNPSPAPISVGWQEQAAMPTARSGLAAAVYENQIYAIGGEAKDQVFDRVERFDPTSNRWENLSPLPTPVTDVQAAVVGGHIFVPGGRTASGDLTNRLAVYDPRQDRWTVKASMPQAVSGYALATFEGKLYLFGGWNGQDYLPDVYEYDPDQDAWHKQAAMPTARGFAAATVASGRIYVIGGRTLDGALTINEVYQPALEGGKTEPWQTRAPLPVGRWGLGAASLADIILIVGGAGDGSAYPTLQYSPNQNAWQPVDVTRADAWTQPGVVALETKLYALGGKSAGVISDKNSAYQVVFTILLPIIRQ